MIFEPLSSVNTFLLSQILFIVQHVPKRHRKKRFRFQLLCDIINGVNSTRGKAAGTANLLLEFKFVCFVNQLTEH